MLAAVTDRGYNGGAIPIKRSTQARPAVALYLSVKNRFGLATVTVHVERGIQCNHTRSSMRVRGIHFRSIDHANRIDGVGPDRFDLHAPRNIRAQDEDQFFPLFDAEAMNCPWRIHVFTIQRQHVVHRDQTEHSKQ